MQEKENKHSESSNNEYDPDIKDFTENMCI